MENIRSIYTLLLLTICTTVAQADVTCTTCTLAQNSNLRPQVNNTIQVLFTGQTTI